MFGLGSVSEDFMIMIGMLIASLIIGLVVFLFSKKELLSVFVFSVLANLSVYFTFIVDFRVFVAYDLIWLRDFSRTIWPLINLVLLIILIIIFIKNAKNKKTKK